MIERGNSNFEQDFQPKVFESHQVIKLHQFQLRVKFEFHRKY